MTEINIEPLIELIMNNWDLFKWYFIAMTFNYFSRGAYRIVKGIILFVLIRTEKQRGV